MSRSKNIRKTTFAFATSTINQLLIQLVTLPIFVLKTDFATYATWILALNFAQFTSVLDFGQVTASQNSFRLLALTNRKHEILTKTKLLNTFVTCTFISYFVLLCTAHRLLPFNLSLSLLGIFVYLNLLQVIFGVFEAVARAMGRPTLGIYASNSLRLSEFLGVLIGLTFYSNSLTYIAICAIVSKSVFFFIILFAQRKNFTVLNFGKLHIPLMKSSLKEGMPFLISKLSDWLILSGILIALSNKISPANLVLFVAARTFFRLGWQLSSVVSSSFSIAIATAWADRNFFGINSLKNTNMKITFVITLIGSVTYFTVGETLFEYWVKNQIQLDRDTLLMGTLYSLVLSVAHAQKTPLNSINRNLSISVATLLSAIAVNIVIIYSNALPTPQVIFSLLVIFEIVGIVSTFYFGKKIFSSF